MGTKTVVHVVFGGAAKSVRTALAAARRPDRVVTTHDTFYLGPINSPDPDVRVSWLKDNLGVGRWLGQPGWRAVVAGNAALLAGSIGSDIHPVVWFSRRNAASYAGFLWWLSHLRDAPCEIIDHTEVMLPARKSRGDLLPRRLAVCPYQCTPKELRNLFDAARPLSLEDRRRYQTRWQGLAQENAALRVTDGTDLVSAPITLFDPLLLAFVTPAWRKMSRVVGGALLQGDEQDLSQTNDLFLFVRLRALAEAGVIEWQGDLGRIHYCEVRRRGG
jgi:hypothetical protein